MAGVWRAAVLPRLPLVGAGREGDGVEQHAVRVFKSLGHRGGSLNEDAALGLGVPNVIPRLHLEDWEEGAFAIRPLTELYLALHRDPLQLLDAGERFAFIGEHNEHVHRYRVGGAAN